MSDVWSILHNNPRIPGIVVLSVCFLLGIGVSILAVRLFKRRFLIWLSPSFDIEMSKMKGRYTVAAQERDALVKRCENMEAIIQEARIRIQEGSSIILSALIKREE